ncbi:unnamed protein product [Cyprideis torosa]|uniref:Uncharacterized protein n=1 Tax=Cyprideis torosa TaxID=163714 RepID=A0A7R8W0S0_9CRUS|nr:unnamed protein product [Cyprideis torosa]CAG0880033.1 unnamed protein product [Cyprideis torosa]
MGDGTDLEAGNTRVAASMSWDIWWTYDGISGPSYWGLINPEWRLCHVGKRQSPINIVPSQLLFDPNLKLIHIDKQRVIGNLTNTGHSVILTVYHPPPEPPDSSGTSGLDEEPMVPSGPSPINITGGPLVYSYQVEQIHLHFGTTAGTGSEHTINGYAFPAEVSLIAAIPRRYLYVLIESFHSKPNLSFSVLMQIQIFGFNSYLYKNFSDALLRPQGIVGISIMLQIGDLSHPELRYITNQLDKIKYGGEQVTLRGISIRALLPDTDFFMTYEGSITMPACHETVTWIIMNKPIYITEQQMAICTIILKGLCLDIRALASTTQQEDTAAVKRAPGGWHRAPTPSPLRQPPEGFHQQTPGVEGQPPPNVSHLAASSKLLSLRKLMQGAPNAPKAPLGNNFRPTLPLHHRVVRTNIDLIRRSSDASKECPTMENTRMFYKASLWNGS